MGDPPRSGMEPPGLYSPGSAVRDAGPSQIRDGTSWALKPRLRSAGCGTPQIRDGTSWALQPRISSEGCVPLPDQAWNLLGFTAQAQE